MNRVLEDGELLAEELVLLAEDLLHLLGVGVGGTRSSGRGPGSGARVVGVVVLPRVGPALLLRLGRGLERLGDLGVALGDVTI